MQRRCACDNCGPSTARGGLDQIVREGENFPSPTSPAETETSNRTKFEDPAMNLVCIWLVLVSCTKKKFSFQDLLHFACALRPEEPEEPTILPDESLCLHLWSFRKLMTCYLESY